MFTVYFEDKSVVFLQDEPAGCGEQTACLKQDGLGIANMLENLENNKRLVVINGHPEKSFDEFLAEFKLLDAAGGLVENNAGEILMIYRNGRWDLPKGHMEQGESPEDCSVREVREETGLQEIERNGLVSVTYHCYLLRGEWIMKKTYWYGMKSPGRDFKPQVEEGITKVEWVAEDKLKEYTGTSFPSVCRVFYDAGKL